MSSFRTLVLLSAAAALAACGQMTASKDKNAPAADSSAPAASTADAGAKPDDAAGGGAKPAEPAQAPAGATPDKPT